MSHGHSGSTLLDFLIGTLPGTFSTGEMVYFPYALYRNLHEKISIKAENICTCDKGFFECEVWSKVIGRLEEKLGEDLHKDPFAFDISIHHCPRFYQKVPLKYKLSHHAYYFLNNISHSLSDGLYRNRYSRSIANNWLFYKSISEVTGSRFVIDSSKDPIRLRLLSTKYPDRIKPIILIRNVFGVSSSGINYGRTVDFENAAKSWLMFYNKKVFPTIKPLLKKVKPLVIHYEDLADNPADTRDKIADFLEIERTPFTNLIHRKNFHLIAGNPMRYRDEITIVHDERWKKHINDEQQALLSKYHNLLHPYFKQQ